MKVVELRERLIRTQGCYEKILSTSLPGDKDKLEVLHADWQYSLVHLLILIEKLDKVVQIFSPEARNAIGGYMSNEQDLPPLDALLIMADDMQQPLTLNYELPVVREKFEKTISEIDKFINKNFQIEEVYEATEFFKN